MKGSTQKVPLLEPELFISKAGAVWTEWVSISLQLHLWFKFRSLLGSNCLTHVEVQIGGQMFFRSALSQRKNVGRFTNWWSLQILRRPFSFMLPYHSAALVSRWMGSLSNGKYCPSATFLNSCVFTGLQNGTVVLVCENLFALANLFHLRFTEQCCTYQSQREQMIHLKM